MWKRIGLIDIKSEDKSSRSKCQKQYESFSQMSKLRSNETHIIFEENQSFCPKYLTKLKASNSNQLLPFKVKSLKDIQNYKSSKNLRQKFKIYGQKNENQQTPSNKTFQQIFLDKLNHSGQKNELQFQEKTILKKQALTKAENANQSKNNLKKLQACRSSPNLLSNQIIEDKKIKTIKNIQALKKQHKLIKKIVNNEIQVCKVLFDQFKNDLNSKMQQKFRIQQQKQKQNQQNKDLHLKSILNRGIEFKDKMNVLNKQKADILAKYKALKSI